MDLGRKQQKRKERRDMATEEGWMQLRRDIIAHRIDPNSDVITRTRPLCMSVASPCPLPLSILNTVNPVLATCLHLRASDKSIRALLPWYTALPSSSCLATRAMRQRGLRGGKGREVRLVTTRRPLRKPCPPRRQGLSQLVITRLARACSLPFAVLPGHLSTCPSVDHHPLADR